MMCDSRKRFTLKRFVILVHRERNVFKSIFSRMTGTVQLLAKEEKGLNKTKKIIKMRKDNRTKES